MTTITIYQKGTKEELVAIPRNEYEKFSKWQDIFKSFKVFHPTRADKKELSLARNDYKKSRYSSLNEFKRKLATRYSR